MSVVLASHFLPLEDLADGIVVHAFGFLAEKLVEKIQMDESGVIK